MDLGADGVQTFRLVTYPTLRSALLAGGLLPFAVSFDEIIVTTFTAGAGVQTLCIWIFTNLTRPTRPPSSTWSRSCWCWSRRSPSDSPNACPRARSEKPARARSQPGEGPRSHRQVPVAEGGDRCLREGTGV